MVLATLSLWYLTIDRPRQRSASVWFLALWFIARLRHRRNGVPSDWDSDDQDEIDFWYAF
jgi:hypothetical protein